MRLFAPTDLPTAAEAVGSARQLAGTGIGFRVGARLLTRSGSGIVTMLREFGPVLADARLAGGGGAVTAAARTLAASGAEYVTIAAGLGATSVAAVVDALAPHGARALVVAVPPEASDEELDVLTAGTGRGRMVSRIAASIADIRGVGLLGLTVDLGVVAQVAPTLDTVVVGIGGAGLEEVRDRGAIGAVLLPGVVGGDPEAASALAASVA